MTSLTRGVLGFAAFFLGLGSFRKQSAGPRLLHTCSRFKVVYLRLLGQAAQDPFN